MQRMIILDTKTGLMNSPDGRLGSLSTDRASENRVNKQTAIAAQFCVLDPSLQSGHGGATPLNLRYAII